MVEDATQRDGYVDDGFCGRFFFFWYVTRCGWLSCFCSDPGTKQIDVENRPLFYTNPIMRVCGGLGVCFSVFHVSFYQGCTFQQARCRCVRELSCFRVKLLSTLRGQPQPQFRCSKSCSFFTTRVLFFVCLVSCFSPLSCSMCEGRDVITVEAAVPFTCIFAHR